MEYRTEKDSMGEINVPASSYWGAQTQRSLNNFSIGQEIMPIEQILAITYVKKASCLANHVLNPKKMTDEKVAGIVKACDLILSRKADSNFPLHVWQTGSGTQTNMNVNEVITNIVNLSLGKKLLHPNDDVNMSQSSNDVFPTAMHIAIALKIKNELVPAANDIIATLDVIEQESQDILKIGRTHLQDAVPIRFSQEVSGWKTSIISALESIKLNFEKICYLPIGGTAVGTGLNAPIGFDTLCVKNLAELTGINFKCMDNKFHGLTTKDEIVNIHGAVKALAINLMKIANDVRWLASGPRCGLGELKIPENEPGSSIMPGKVNPTQCEAVSMAAVQIMGNDQAISIAASQGNFELNVFMPVIIYNAIQSIQILTDVIASFNAKCLVGLQPIQDRMDYYLNNSLMLVTCLNGVIGYEKAAEVAKFAYKNNTSLKDAADELGYVSKEDFDKIVRPENMV